MSDCTLPTLAITAGKLIFCTVALASQWYGKMTQAHWEEEEEEEEEKTVWEGEIEFMLSAFPSSSSSFHNATHTFPRDKQGWPWHSIPYIFIVWL